MPKKIELTAYPEHFWSKVDRSGECWLWKGSRSSNGYGQCYPGRNHTYTHRYAYCQAVGPIPNGMSVLHRCDTPACVRPDHLFLGTQQDNLRDMVQKGRWSSGQPRKGSKLFTSTQIDDICAAYANGASYLGLARQYGCSDSTITRTIRRRLVEGGTLRPYWNIRPRPAYRPTCARCGATDRDLIPSVDGNPGERVCAPWSGECYRRV